MTFELANGLGATKDKKKKKDKKTPDYITCHSKRSSQPRCQFLGIIVSQLHAANSDNLTNKADLLSFKVLTAQVLGIRTMQRPTYCKKKIPFELLTGYRIAIVP